MLTGRIDDYLENMDEEERKFLSPSKVLHRLLDNPDVEADVLASPRDGWDLAGTAHSFSCATIQFVRKVGIVVGSNNLL